MAFYVIVVLLILLGISLGTIIYCYSVSLKNTFCFGPKFCTLITSVAKITRHHPDTVNYQAHFDQSRTRIKFEYIIM